MLQALDISASALEAQRLRMEVVTNNMANAETTRATRGPDGAWQPYRRRQVVFQAMLEGSAGSKAGGVRVDHVEEDPSDFRKVFNPHDVDADADGYVKMPNVDPLMEMVDLMEASRAYEANVTAMEATKSIVASSLRILA